MTIPLNEAIRVLYDSAKQLLSETHCASMEIAKREMQAMNVIAKHLGENVEWRIKISTHTISKEQCTFIHVTSVEPIDEQDSDFYEWVNWLE